MERIGQRIFVSIKQLYKQISCIEDNMNLLKKKESSDVDNINSQLTDINSKINLLMLEISSMKVDLEKN